MDTDEFDQHTMTTIMEHGWQVVLVPDAEPTFGYTVGLSLRDQPELYMAGDLNPLAMQAILNDVASLPLEVLEPGAEFDEILEDMYKVRLIECDPYAAEMFQAIRFAEADNSPLTALQILWPDVDGNFPGEPGYDTEANVQPMYEFTDS